MKNADVWLTDVINTRFGAVVEEWEVEDVLEELFATKYSQA